MKIHPGLEAAATYLVQAEDLAIHWGSEMPVLASPVLIGRFEEACMKATDHLLASTETTVGVGFDILHISPSPADSKIEISARLEEVKGERLTFDVEAHDSSGLISSGMLHRVIVKKSSFLGKLQKKLEQSKHAAPKASVPVAAQASG